MQIHTDSDELKPAEIIGIRWNVSKNERMPFEIMYLYKKRKRALE
jgi:hypothetical protein